MRNLAMVVGVTILSACLGEGTDPPFSDSTSGTQSDAEGGCGGEAAHGGYTKAGGEWDGSAGNSYGYPASDRPAEDCYGFGFHDTCTFWESCTYACTSSTECPADNVGVAVPECRERAPVSAPGVVFTEESLCVLPCAVVEDCPEGMGCVDHAYGFGRICMWAR